MPVAPAEPFKAKAVDFYQKSTAFALFPFARSNVSFAQPEGKSFIQMKIQTDD